MKSTRVPFLVAILLAAVAAGSVYAYSASLSQRAETGSRTVRVFVAAGEIAAGVSLTEAKAGKLLRLETYPANAVPTGRLESVTEANSNLVALSALPAGQLLTRSNFGEALMADRNLQVPAGLIAISVNLDDPQKVGTFLAPGSEIVVFDTVIDQQSPSARTPIRATHVLLPRARVLAVGSKLRSSDANPASGSTVVTLAVDQKGAERLVHADNIGDLYFGLLNRGTKIIADSGVTDKTLHR